MTDTLSLNQSPDAAARTQQLLAQADDWELAAIDAATTSSKSFLVALAVVRGRIGAAGACAAARVAEQHQINEWGEVEAGHDIDAADLAVRLGASSAFVRMLGRYPTGSQ